MIRGLDQARLIDPVSIPYESKSVRSSLKVDLLLQEGLIFLSQIADCLLVLCTANLKLMFILCVSKQESEGLINLSHCIWLACMSL